MILTLNDSFRSLLDSAKFIFESLSCACLLPQASVDMSHRCRTGSVSDLCLLISVMSSQYVLVMTDRHRFFTVKLVICLHGYAFLSRHRRHRSFWALSSRQTSEFSYLCLNWLKASWITDWSCLYTDMHEEKEVALSIMNNACFCEEN